MSTVLGIDPGLAHCGIAAFHFEADSIELLAVDVLETERSPKEDDVPASVDNMARGRELANWLGEHLNAFAPAIVAAEAMSFPRHALAANMLGMAWGIVSTLSVQRGLTVVQATPQAIKRALGVPKAPSGDAEAKAESKRKVVEAIQARWPAVVWPKRKGLHEHAADAAGAVVACEAKIRTELARQRALVIDVGKLMTVGAT